jgi:hypothetical protein
MTNISINYTKKALEISKDFSKKASIFGSEAYNELKAAKKDFPTFRVSVKQAPKRKLEDRISMNDITMYVKEKSGENSKEMNTLKDLRGKSIKDAGGILKAEESANFIKIKQWFFDTYPEIADKTKVRQNHINAILAEAASNAVSA